MKRAALVILLAVISVTAAATARAEALTGDPRVCAAATTADATADANHHAYECAKLAAIAVTRKKMATVQNVKRWYAPTFCATVKGSMLRWSCTTILGGDSWTAAVTFRAAPAGWKRIVIVTQNP